MFLLHCYLKKKIKKTEDEKSMWSLFAAKLLFKLILNVD